MLKLRLRAWHMFTLILTLQIIFLHTVQSDARDLTDVLVQGFTFGGLLDPVPTASLSREVAPIFAAAVAQAVTQEFPLASAAPAFTYRFNPTLHISERFTGVPGPIFSERALTLGEGQFNVSVGYAFIDFSELDGTDMEDLRSQGLFADVLFGEGRPLGEQSPGEGLFYAPFILSRVRTQIDLQVHVMTPTLRYGITPNWEVSVSVPIINTFLRVRTEAVRILDLPFPAYGYQYLTDAQGRRVPNKNKEKIVSAAGQSMLEQSQLPFVKAQRPSMRLSKGADSATGVGDLTLRTKYHLWHTEAGGAALGLNLQLPSGEVQDFHGTDETHLSTFVYLSQIFLDYVEPHLNVGVDFNANDVDRSSFLYAAGVTLLVGTRIGVVVDFIGRSEFGRFPVRVPSESRAGALVPDRAPKTCIAEQPCFFGEERNTEIPYFPVDKLERNDIANFTVGLRYALGTRGSIFFGAVVPLNDEGLRPDFIPSGGIEYTF